MENQIQTRWVTRSTTQMPEDDRTFCVRVRLEGKTRQHIVQAANDMGVHVQRVFEKSSKASGYSFYAYGNSAKKYPTKVEGAPNPD